MEGMLRRAKRFICGKLGRHRVVLPLLFLTAFGCGSHASFPYPSYAPQTDPLQANLIEKSNAYSDYQAAAEELDQELGASKSLLLKSSYSPGEQARLEKAAALPLKKIKQGLRKVCQIPYASPRTPQATAGRMEWRALSKVLVWRIQEACQAHSYGGAIEACVLASKFGYDLTSGLPNDASLGLLTVDQARAALAPSISSMESGQLETLSRAMKTVYLARPPLTTCFEYAGRDSLQEVQDIQDAYKSEHYEDLNRRLGSEAKEVVPILKELHQQSESKRSAFFEGFAEDAKIETAKLKEDLALPLSARQATQTIKPGVERPWRKLSRRLLGIGEPILRMNDATSARTQLLIIECEIIRTLKIEGKTPANLDKFSSQINTDPYTGQPFIYRTDGSDYKLYSVGEDLIDNDGETDETFTTPDLTIEKHMQ